MFHPLIDDTQKALFQRTGAWPTAMSLINASNGKLMITCVTKIVKGTLVTFGVSTGFNVYTLTIPDKTGRDGDPYKLFGMLTPADPPIVVGTPSVLVETKSPRYLSSIVANTGKPVYKNINSLIEAAENWHQRMLCNALNNFYENARRKDFSSDISMSIATRKWLLDYYNNVTQVPPVEIAQEIANVNNHQRKLDDFEATYASTISKMFAKDKWFVLFHNGLVTVGVIKSSELRNVMLSRRIDPYLVHSTQFTFDYLEAFVGYDGIDPSIKDELLGRLTMAKQLRERTHPTFTNSTDKSGFTVNATLTLPTINTIYDATRSNRCFSVLIDRD